MIQTQIKLRLHKPQEAMLNQWLWHLTGVWNWAIRKIEMDAQGGIYYTQHGFQCLLANHGKKLGIPSHTLQGILVMAWTAWQRCYKKVGGNPRLKGKRNRMASIPFPDPIKLPNGLRISLPMLGLIKYHKQAIPKGKIKCGRIVKRASGWYLCLFIDAQPKAIAHKANRVVGIDPGFKHLLTFSDGEKIENPRWYIKAQERLAQTQRGRNKKKVARIQEHIADQRKDFNHKLSHRLTAECEAIYFSKDNDRAIAKRFGKSVLDAGHGQLRRMQAYKMPTSGRLYSEVKSRKSTMRCSSCGALTGPTGLDGLAVRQWACSCCGHDWDRDINAALNTLNAGLGRSLEERVA